MARGPEIMCQLNMDGSGFMRTLQTATRGVTKWTSEVAGRIGGAFTIGAMGYHLKSIMDWAGNMHDLAKSIGITGEEMQVLNIAMKQAGMNAEKVIPSIKALVSAREKALNEGPTGSNRRMFEALGFSQGELAATTKTFDLLTKLLGRLREMPAGMERMDFMNRLFGKGGMQFANILDENLNAVRKLLEELGVLVSNEQLARLDAAGDKWAALLEIWKGFAAIQLGRFAEDVSPPLPPGPTWLTRMAAKAVGRQSAADLAPAANAFKQFFWSVETLGKVFNFFFKKEQAAPSAQKGGPLMGPVGTSVSLAADAIANELATMVPESIAKLPGMSFTPYSDMLARIGGFTGRGGYSKVEDATTKTAQNTTELVRQLRNILTSIAVTPW